MLLNQQALDRPMDERNNLPSASSFSMDAACHGRQNLLRSVSPSHYAVERDDTMASRGSRIHDALHTGDVQHLDEDEMHDWSKASDYQGEALKSWQPDGQEVTQIREQRLWMKSPQGERILSGKPDVVYFSGTKALTLDFKTGFNPHLSPSERNWQLRVLAVLVFLNYPTVSEVRVGFIKPKSKFQPTDLTDYSYDDLLTSEAQIRSILARSKREDSPRIAGAHCRFCQVKNHCQEAAAMSLLPSVMAKASVDLKKADIVARVSQMTDADKVAVKKRSLVIRTILNAIEDDMKAWPAEKLAAFGWKIGKGKRLDPIVNTEGAFKVLEHTIPQSVWGCMKLTKGSIVDALVAERGMAKKDAEQWVKDNLDLFVEQKESEGSLEEIS